MLNVYRSNRLENLADALAEVLETPLRSPFDTEWIAVSSQSMRTWLARQLARRMGVWAGGEFPFPREMIAALLDSGKSEPTQAPEFGSHHMAFAILSRLPELLPLLAFADLEQYLEGDQADLKQVQLASQIAHTFDEYALYRPEMTAAWEGGAEDHWQAELWRRLKRDFGFRHVGEVRPSDLEGAAAQTPHRTGRMSFFAVSLLPSIYYRLLSAVSETLEIHLFALSPSKEWWADLKTTPRGSIPTDVGDGNINAELEVGNPLLASLGRQARDFQWILEDTTAYSESGERYTDPADANDSLLFEIQSDVLNLRFPSPPPADSPRRADGTVRIASCHSRLREIEALKDQILDIMSVDPSIGPDDITVLAPDIKRYIPFIEAVFSAHDVSIPFNIAGEAAPSTTSFVRGLLALLQLFRSRFTVLGVFDVLEHEAVRTKFDLSEDEVTNARRFVVDAGVRWGMDGTHRETFDQPGFNENTWRFGMDRLLLGVALSPDGTEAFGGMTPALEIDRDSADIVSKLTTFLETLFESAERLTAPRPVDRWMRDFETLMDRMMGSPDGRNGAAFGVDTALREMANEAAVTRCDVDLDLTSAAYLLEQRLEALERRKGWYPGGVTFSSLLPMRSIPYPVVCLVGMNDREFPRHHHPPAFDLMAAHPRIGDRSQQSDDRQLFLEAVLQARQALLISYVGQSAVNGSELSPSVLVRDFEELLVSGYGISRETLVTAHPLQPFSPRYFSNETDPALFSYSRIHRDAADALANREAVPQPFYVRSASSSDEDEPESIEIEDMCRFFRQPARYWTTHRLGMTFPRWERPIPEREPLEAGSPDDRLARKQAVALLLDGIEPEETLTLIRARGLLPLGKAGAVRFDRLVRQTEPLVGAVGEARQGSALPPVDVDINLQTPMGATRLSGAVTDVWPSARVAYDLWPLGGPALIDAWIRHLALLVSDAPDVPRASRLFSLSKTGTVEVFELGDVSETATALLSDLAEIYRIGKRELLPLLPEVAYEVVRSELHPGRRKQPVDPRAAWEAAWSSSDIAVITAFRGRDPFDWAPSPELSFDALAHRVFAPVLR